MKRVGEAFDARRIPDRRSGTACTENGDFERHWRGWRVYGGVKLFEI